MQTNYNWEDLKSYFKDNPTFPDAYDKLLREEKKDDRLLKETCKDLSGVWFRVEWDLTPEGRLWWHSIYKVLLEEDRKLEEIQA